jgi:hypothetical protein
MGTGRDDRRRTEGALSAQRGGEDPPGVVYFYAPGRSGENAETFLTGFDGILQIDGYQGYNRLTKPTRKGGAPIRVAHCWTHARRKLKEVFDRDGSEIAAEGLRRIAQIYAVEADIRGQRLSARQARSASAGQDVAHGPRCDPEALCQLGRRQTLRGLADDLHLLRLCQAFCSGHAEERPPISCHLPPRLP